jgi:hypothetical protein
MGNEQANGTFGRGRWSWGGEVTGTGLRLACVSWPHVGGQGSQIGATRLRGQEISVCTIWRTNLSTETCHRLNGRS